MSEFLKHTEQTKDNSSDDPKERLVGRKEIALALGLSALVLVNTQLERGSGFGKYRTIEGLKADSIAEQVVTKIEDFFADEDGNTVHSTSDGNGGTVDFMIEDGTPHAGGHFSEPTAEDGKVIDFSFLEDEDIPYGTPESSDK